MDDRPYHYWIGTFETKVSASEASYAIEKSVQNLAEEGVSITGYEVYRDVGAVDFAVDRAPVRSWDYCAVIEFAELTDIQKLIDNPPAELMSRDWGQGIYCLSSEIAVRPQKAGTSVPRPLLPGSSLPEQFKVAVEYIWIPGERWADYHNFMKTDFGPVGTWLVENGFSHKIIVTERVHSYFHDQTLPKWNCIHILTGNFDDDENGFKAGVARAVKAVIGPQHTPASALAPALKYRRKPKMSKNEMVRSVWHYD